MTRALSFALIVVIVVGLMYMSFQAGLIYGINAFECVDEFV